MNSENSNGISRDQLLTVGDLEKFRDELVSEIKQLLDGSKQHQVKQWLRSSEVRKLLGISPGTLQNFRVNGTLSFTKIGGIVFYKYEDIVNLLDSKSNPNG